MLANNWKGPYTRQNGLQVGNVNVNACGLLMVFIAIGPCLVETMAYYNELWLRFDGAIESNPIAIGRRQNSDVKVCSQGPTHAEMRSAHVQSNAFALQELGVKRSGSGSEFDPEYKTGTCLFIRNGMM